MTTTAEKIKVMQAFDKWKTKGFEQPAIIQKTPRANSDWREVGYEPQWNWEAFKYRIKPPDPKPMECWLNIFRDGDVYAYTDAEYAKENSANSPMGSVERTAVHMREVTPQDEQDRKDAARYRKAKKISCNMTFNVSQWDQIIDKAIV